MRVKIWRVLCHFNLNKNFVKFQILSNFFTMFLLIKERNYLRNFNCKFQAIVIVIKIGNCVCWFCVISMQSFYCCLAKNVNWKFCFQFQLQFSLLIWKYIEEDSTFFSFTCLAKNLIENKYVGKIHYFKFPQTFSKSPKRKEIFIFKKNQFTFMPFKPNYNITYLSHSITFSVYFFLFLWNLQNHFVNKINVLFYRAFPFMVASFS